MQYWVSLLFPASADTTPPPLTNFLPLITNSPNPQLHYFFLILKIDKSRAVQVSSCEIATSTRLSFFYPLSACLLDVEGVIGEASVALAADTLTG